MRKSVICKEMKYRRDFFPNSRSKKVREMEVDIQELFFISCVAKEETEVAFIIHDSESVYNPKINTSEYIKTHREILLYDNELFEEALIPSGEFIGTNEDIDKVMDGIIKAYSPHILFDAKDHYDETKSIVVDNNWRETSDGIQNELNNYLFVDGVLYKKTGEPYYKIQTFGLGNNHGGTGFFIEKNTIDSETTHLSDYCYPANEYKNAFTCFEKTAKERGDTNSLGCYTDDYIEVLNPKCVNLKRLEEFAIPVSYTVKGTVKLKAKNKNEALKKIKKNNEFDFSNVTETEICKETLRAEI